MPGGAIIPSQVEEGRCDLIYWAPRLKLDRFKRSSYACRPLATGENIGLYLLKPDCLAFVYRQRRWFMQAWGNAPGKRFPNPAL